MKDTGLCGTLNEGKGNCSCGKSFFYWPAVIVAGLIGVGLSFLFTLLSLAFGFTAFSPASTGGLVFSTGGFVGLVIAAVISMFMVGWIAGYLGRPFCVKKYYGELYGLTAWSLALILSILLAASSEKLITNTTYLVNKNVAPVAFSVSVEKMATKATGVKNTNTSEKNAEALAMTSFVTFFLFFMGALASSFGGRCALLYYGQRCCDKNKPTSSS